MLSLDISKRAKKICGEAHIRMNLPNSDWQDIFALGKNKGEPDEQMELQGSAT